MLFRSSAGDEDVFSSISLKYKELIDNDKIIVKYKDVEKQNLPTPMPRWTSRDVTWTDQTTFTCVLDLENAEVGDEVEIIGGAAAGVISHISAITKSEETYTVTLEDTIDLVTASDTSKVYVDNWKKLETINADYADNFKQITVNKKSDWIQFKIELRGVGVTIEELIIDNSPNRL